MSASPLDAVLDDLAERVAAKVLARMTAPTSHYGTGRTATLPPGKSRAWALRTVRTIPGARKVGRDWIVPVADFDAWLVDRDTSKSAGDSRQPANDVEAMADAALLVAGLRRTRSP